MPLESLNCPNCGAPLPDPAGRPTITCAHCHTVVRVSPTTAPSPAPLVGPPPSDELRPYTPSEPIPAEVSAKLIELLRAGRRLEATEHYQARAGVTEAQAQDVIDAIQAGLPPAAMPTGQVDLDRIKWLLANRRRTYAIQFYREQAGVTLSDAAQAIEAIEAGREPPPIVPAAPRRLSADELSQIRSLIERGEKNAAIKFYQEHTGRGLKKSRAAVEAIARGGGEPPEPEAAPARAPRKALAGDKLAQVQNFLRAHDKLGAIKLYRGFTGLGLKEAQDAVEAIAASTPGVDPRLGKSDNRGCYNFLLLIVLFVMCLLGGCGAYAQTTGTYRCVITEFKNDPAARELLGDDVNAGYLVLSPSYNQGWDFDGSWRLAMTLYMPAWGSRGVGLLALSARADDTGYTALRATLYQDFQRRLVRGWETVECP